MHHNLMAKNAANAYQRASVTVAPAWAIVKLYEGAITRLERAVAALEVRRLDESYNNVLRVVTILRGLRHNLDFDRGGVMAERLSSMYSKNIIALLRSVGKPDAAARYQKIANGLRGLRDAWTVVAKLPPESYRDASKPASELVERRRR
jgi:flagellar secretion chaperone FliS